MDEINKLLKTGCLGFYDQVEVTEIFACLPNKSVVNIFTIIVAEDRSGADLISPEIINKERIKNKSLKGWNFGVKQYTKSIADIVSHLGELNNLGNWSASGHSLLLGTLEYQPPKFVAPDSYDNVPVNKILKNNFWNGSYIAEWYDKEKLQIKPLLEQPALLQELSEKIQGCIPVALASVSDRLGNVVFQIPVNVLMAKFCHSRQENNLELEVAWQPNAIPRKLRVNCEMEYDQIINGYASHEVEGDNTFIPMSYDHGPHKGVVWDDENKLILAAIRPSSFISFVSFNMNLVNPEPRVFNIANDDGEQQVRIKIKSQTQANTVGTPSSNADSWTQKRLYKDEKKRLAKQRKFVQYTPTPGNQDGEHEKALRDIRALINQYGTKGVWLWDPYLGATDVLKTLFYCPIYGADLRALTNLDVHTERIKSDSWYAKLLKVFTDCEVYSNPKSSSGKSTQLEIQQKKLQNLKSNFYGLTLEFRAKIGGAGWEFHDRFIIFPETSSGTLAWSLGTSVNSLGKKHHILQQVDDGQLVADSFLELWGQLDKPEHLIWKHS